MTLYRCLIAEQTDDEAFIQTYWAYAEHIGAAIEKILRIGKANGLTKPEPCELDPYDIENLHARVIPDASAEVFWMKGKAFFDPEPIFRLPYGIIASGVEGEHDVENIVPGFHRYKDDTGKTTLEINVAREHLLSLYEQLLSVRQTYKVFWYLLHDHWEKTHEQFLVNTSLNTPDAIGSHIRGNKLDSLMNGYVTLTSYHDDGATNLNISDHKRIIIFTFSDGVADEYAKVPRSSGYPEISRLVAIDYLIHHWHYRFPESRSREKLISYLHQSGFSNWDPKGKTEQ